MKEIVEEKYIKQVRIVGKKEVKKYLSDDGLVYDTIEKCKIADEKFKKQLLKNELKKQIKEEDFYNGNIYDYFDKIYNITISEKYLKDFCELCLGADWKWDSLYISGEGTGKYLYSYDNGGDSNRDTYTFIKIDNMIEELHTILEFNNIKNCENCRHKKDDWCNKSENFIDLKPFGSVECEWELL